MTCFFQEVFIAKQKLAKKHIFLRSKKQSKSFCLKTVNVSSRKKLLKSSFLLKGLFCLAGYGPGFISLNFKKIFDQW